MKPIYFHTNDELHKKFKLICGILDTDIKKTMNDLMQKYVTENESLISNPEIQNNIPVEIPQFFGEQGKWHTYIGRSDKNQITKILHRVSLLRYFISLNLIDKNNDPLFIKDVQDLKSFQNSEDFSYLAEYGIFKTVRTWSPKNDIKAIY